MHIRGSTLKLVYMHNELLHVSAVYKYMVISSDVKQKG